MTHSRFSAAVLLLGAAALAGCADAPLSPTPTAKITRTATADVAPARYVVLFRSANGIPADFAATVASLGGSVAATMPEVGAAVVDGISGSAAASLARAGGVQSVDLDEAIPLPSGMAQSEAASFPDAVPASPTHPELAGLYVYQWNMRAINAEAAWNAGYLGSSDVTVAILDGGIDEGTASGPRSNIDLQGRVDRVRSRSFVPMEDTLVQRLFPGAPLWTDLDGHGTNVASQVASNGYNFAGVTSRTTLMSVKVCTILPPPATEANPTPRPGYCPFSSIFAGFYYAVDAGADVINMSLGGYFEKRDCHGCASLFARLMAYGKSHGVTVVVAAGNSGIDLDHDTNGYATYCNSPNAICVSATGALGSGPRYTGPFPMPDTPAFYTNYGRSAINVAAPGGNVDLSTGAASYVWSLCPRLTAAQYVPALGTALPLGPCTLYGFIGTSQATPHVSGLAALLVVEYGRNPGLIRSRIMSGADDLGQRGTDPYYGKGRINVGATLGVN